MLHGFLLIAATSEILKYTISCVVLSVWYLWDDQFLGTIVQLNKSYLSYRYKLEMPHYWAKQSLVSFDHKGFFWSEKWKTHK